MRVEARARVRVRARARVTVGVRVDEPRRAPTTFLYATESRLRSSSDRSSAAFFATSFMYSTCET